jgi:PAS domain-containing protein
MQNIKVAGEPEAGIFTWHLAEDRLYGDTAVAALFGLDPVKTLRGLPASEYIARIFPADRPLVARLWSKAVTGGRPYRAEYRVVDATGRIRHVMSFGRCFRDRAGNPVHYAGIVHELSDDEVFQTGGGFFGKKPLGNA